MNRIGVNVKAHWVGLHTRPGKRWLNLIAPLSILLGTHLFVVAPAVANGQLPVSICVLTFAFLYGAVFVWWLVGINRVQVVSGQSPRKSFSSVDDVLIFNLAAFVLMLYLIVQLLDLSASENTAGLPPVMKDTGFKPVPPSLHLEVFDGYEQVLFVTGEFGIAATQQLRRYLETNKGIEQLVLKSLGGSVFEARGVAKLVAEYGLDTHVNEVCLSACTIAFSGGINRTASLSAEFGFHAYRLDAKYPAVWLKPEEEQKKDEEWFRSRGISDAFLAKIYKVDSSSLWYPDHQLSLDAGFLTGIKTDPKVE